MAYYPAIYKFGESINIDDILSNGQISTTSSYATANFEDISEYDFLFIKAYYDYNGVLKEYTTAVDVSQILLANILDFNIRTSEIGNLTLRITKTSIQAINYGGAWRNIYCDIKATKLEVWD